MTRGRRTLVLAIAGAAAAVSLVAVVGAAQVLGAWNDVERFPLTPTAEAGEATFTVIVGTDGRPGDDDPLAPSFGDRATVEGERADLVVVVRTGGGSPDRMLIVPRELVIDGGAGPPGRLAVDWLDGPQSFTDRLCLGLGVPADHLVAVAPSALVFMVDAVGGLDVEVVNRIRDQRSKLAPIGPGRERLDGVQALAWVRSRQPEVLTDNGWRRIADPAQGSLLRNERTPALISTVSGRMLTRPWSSVPALDEVAAGLRVDDQLSLRELVSLGRTVRDVEVVRPDVVQGRTRIPVAVLTAAGATTIEEFVGDTRCTPSPG
jgi:hypothetical protein